MSRTLRRLAYCLEHPLLAARRGAGEEHLCGVDVALGDRALRVAGLQLHVHHRVAGRRLMCERRVPEVVEGPEWLGDPCTTDGRTQVDAGELGGVERRPFLRVAEDEF